MPDFFQNENDFKKKLDDESKLAILENKTLILKNKELKQYNKKTIEDEHKEFIHIELKNKILDYDLKRLFSCRVTVITFSWFVFIVIISFVHLQKIFDVNRFSDSVLIVLYSTTTANVIGLMITILHYLFPNKIKK